MAAEESEQRKQREDPGRWILYDTRRNDFYKGRDNDLTLEFIDELLESCDYMCFYCGETEIKMTLDRIDNALGHLQSNVIPACLRCNVVRGDMPYRAWLEEIAPAMRKARRRGLFKYWTGKSGRLSPLEKEARHQRRVDLCTKYGLPDLE
jgi:hypothetical protein